MRVDVDFYGTVCFSENIYSLTSSSDGGCIVVSEEVERLRIQSQSELEVFVKKFAKKYRSLFRSGTFSYRFQPNLDFLYEVYLEIQLAE